MLRHPRRQRVLRRGRQHRYVRWHAAADVLPHVRLPLLVCRRRSAGAAAAAAGVSVHARGLWLRPLAACQNLRARWRLQAVGKE